MARAAARHILVSTEAQCNALKQQIAAGADFAELAKQHSSCPSGRDGGALGTFSPGQMVKEFDQVVFSAPIGVVQGPVKTQFGYHVIKVDEKRDVPPPALEEVEPQVRQMVMREKYLKELGDAKKGMKVEITDEALRKGYEEVNKDPQ